MGSVNNQNNPELIKIYNNNETGAKKPVIEKNEMKLKNIDPENKMQGAYRSKPKQISEGRNIIQIERPAQESENQQDEKLKEILKKPFSTLSNEDKNLRCEYKFKKGLQQSKEEFEFARQEKPQKSPQKSLFSNFIKSVKDIASSKNPSRISSYSDWETDPSPTRQGEKTSAEQPKPKEIEINAAKEFFIPESSPLTGMKSNGRIQSSEAFNFVETSQEEIKKLQKHMKNINKTYPSLKIEKMPLELTPTHKLSVGNATYYCSDVLQLKSPKGEGKGHKVVISFVAVNGDVYPRLFYQSNSQASWRVAPAIAKKDDRFGYINKGEGEHTTQLPIALNAALHKLHSQALDSKSTFPVLEPDQSHNLVQTRNQYGIGKLDYTFNKHVRHLKFVEHSVTAFEHYTDPASLKVEEPELEPNFNAAPVDFTFESPVYGKVKAHIFPSKNNSAQYLFYETEDGKVFLSSVEILENQKNTLNPINKYGSREMNPELEGLDSPLREYRQNMGQKHLESAYWPEKEGLDPTGTYISFWNYVREIPLIKSYYEARGLPIPDRV